MPGEQGSENESHGSQSPSAPQGFLGNRLFFCEILIIQLFAWTNFGFWVVLSVPASRLGYW